MLATPLLCFRCHFALAEAVLFSFAFHLTRQLGRAVYLTSASLLTIDINSCRIVLATYVVGQVEEGTGGQWVTM